MVYDSDVMEVMALLTTIVLYAAERVVVAFCRHYCCVDLAFLLAFA